MATKFSEDPALVDDRSQTSFETLNPYQPAFHAHANTQPERVGTRQTSGPLWLLFSFEGRIPRRVFWPCRLVFIAISLALGLGIRAINDMDSVVGPLASLLISPFTIWMSLAVEVKRWHDLGKSGWNSLYHLVPCVGVIIILIQLGFLRGTEGENSYGEDPT